MFKHLPKVSRESAEVMVDRELPELVARVEQSQTPTEGLNHLCAELDQSNPWLGKSVRAIGEAIYRAHHKDYPDIPWGIIKAWSAVGVIASLLLVDKALQAMQLETQLFLDK